MNNIPQTRSRKPQAGFTLVELMIAAMVLTFGLLALAALFSIAIGNNGRSRVDSTATMLSQSVLEQISATLASGGPSSVTDCIGNLWPVCNPDAPAGLNCPTSTNGAALLSSGTGIDFSQTNPPSGYQMNYVVCNGGGELGTQAVYDVRWNITQQANSYLVMVAARPTGMVRGRFTFALPVTLRTYVGTQ